MGSVARNGSIGGDLLSRFTVVFDFPNEKMYLKKNHSFNNKFHYNLSGLTIKAKGAHLNVYEITEVRDNSVGSSAGIMAGDLIVNINGAHAKDLTLSQVIGYLTSKPGKKIHVELNRQGEHLKKEFVLKDQI